MVREVLIAPIRGGSLKNVLGYADRSATPGETGAPKCRRGSMPETANEEMSAKKALAGWHFVCIFTV